METARRSNLRHRPIGLGVQGLADTFLLLGMPFDSEEAAQLNRWVSLQQCRGGDVVAGVPWLTQLQLVAVGSVLCCCSAALCKWTSHTAPSYHVSPSCTWFILDQCTWSCAR